MDSFWSIMIVIAIVVISDQFGSKKKKVPTRPLPKPAEGPGRQKMPLPWPDIRPPVPAEPQEPEIYAEPEVPVLRQSVLRKPSPAKRAPEPEQVMAPVKSRPSGLGLTPEQAISALAWAEILGQPKAYKNGRFRR